MLWQLLGHALDLRHPERDTLLEEGLRLLVSVLNCAAAFMPALQVHRAAGHDALWFLPLPSESSLACSAASSCA